MKRIFALLFASVLLVFALAACGKDEQNATDDHNGQAVTEDDKAPSSDAGDNPVTDGGTSGGEGDSVPNRDEDPIAGTDGSMDQNAAAKQRARAADTTYGQMLRNAQVHDSDGFLKDLENAVIPDSAR